MKVKNILAATAVMGLALSLTAQARDEDKVREHEEDMANAAVAKIQGTEGNEDVRAVIHFKTTDEGLAYNIKAQGLKPGKHAYHIHFYGDCTASDADSAGTHFNLKGSSHNPPDDIDRITGDLGDLDVDDNGEAEDSGILEDGMLQGDKSIIGRSVIIHEKPNDYSEPPIGAAGDRDACGVIGIAESDDDHIPESNDDDSADDEETANTH